MRRAGAAARPQAVPASYFPDGPDGRVGSPSSTQFGTGLPGIFSPRHEREGRHAAEAVVRPLLVDSRSQVSVISRTCSIESNT